MKFKIGDRVKYIQMYDNCRALANQIGTVRTISLYDIGVEFDIEFVGGHDCYGQGKAGHCWYLPEDYLELVKAKAIEVYGIVKFMKETSYV
jgi:hypothetical protein